MSLGVAQTFSSKKKGVSGGGFSLRCRTSVNHGARLQSCFMGRRISLHYLPHQYHPHTHKIDPQIFLLMYECGRVTISDEFVTLWLQLFLASAKTNPPNLHFASTSAGKSQVSGPSTGRLPLCFFFILLCVPPPPFHCVCARYVQIHSAAHCIV